MKIDELTIGEAGHLLPLADAIYRAAAKQSDISDLCPRGHHYSTRTEYGSVRRFCRECHNTNRRNKSRNGY
jgi:hypothetical protein